MIKLIEFKENKGYGAAIKKVGKILTLIYFLF